MTHRKMTDTERFIMGPFKAKSFSARVKSICTSVAATSNFFISNFSRTKLFTTRMPETFSSTDSLRASYLRKTRRKIGSTFRITKKRPKAKGMVT